MSTRVVFRKWKGENDDVFALFPDDIADLHGHVTCYQHVGGHAAANYALCIAHSQPAKPEEYESLKAELERIGYSLLIRTRRSIPAQARR
jgi:hypothetical protein